MSLQPGKPSWADAPAWAKFLAMDADGSWWWYEYPPVAGDEDEARFFRNRQQLGQFKCAHSPDVDWQATLESRPPAEQAEQNVNDM